MAQTLLVRHSLYMVLIFLKYCNIGCTAIIEAMNRCTDDIHSIVTTAPT